LRHNAPNLGVSVASGVSCHDWVFVMQAHSLNRNSSYPECCIDAHQREKAAFESAVIAAYIAAFGANSERIAEALLKDSKVRME